MNKYKEIKSAHEYEDFIQKFAFYIDSELSRLEEDAKNKPNDLDGSSIAMLIMALETLDAMYYWGVPLVMRMAMDKSEFQPKYLSGVFWMRLKPLVEAVKKSGNVDYYTNEFEKFL